MKANRILAFLIVALSVLTSLPSAFASKAAANRAYVQSGPDGVFYARCIPRDTTGSAGSTDIYRVRKDHDELVDHYDWYSAHGVVLGWSPIAGKVAVMVLHRDAPTTPDKQVEFTLHLGGKLLKSWTTTDLLGLGAEVGPDHTDGGKRAEFQVVGCEQIEIPGSNQYAFTLRLSTGRLQFFNILTGEEYVPLGRDLDLKKNGGVVTPKPDAIDQLVAKVSATHGLWRNGKFLSLKLPPTASPEQIVEQFFKMRHVTDYKILQSRSVQIDGEPYTAAEVQSERGRKVVLFTAGGAWNREYDAEEAENSGAPTAPPSETGKTEESPIKSSLLPADDSPQSTAAAAKMGAETAAADIKAGVFRILYYGEPYPLKPLVDEATGYRVQIVAGCIVSSQFVAETNAYNQAMRAWHAKNPPSSAKPSGGQTQILCPDCKGVCEAMPRLGGVVTKDGYNLHLAGKAVADGSCIGERTVFVCRHCGKFSEDGIHAWKPLPAHFGSQPATAESHAPPFKTGIRNVEPPVGSLGYKIGSYLTIEGVRDEVAKGAIRTLRVDTINGHKLDQPVPIWMNGVELPEKERCIFKGFETGQWIGVPHEVYRATGRPPPQAGWQFMFSFCPTSVEQPKNLEIK